MSSLYRSYLLNISTIFRAIRCSGTSLVERRDRHHQQCLHTCAAPTARNSVMEVVLAKPPPCISSTTNHEDFSSLLGKTLLSLSAGVATAKPLERPVSEPWTTPRAKRLLFREILMISLTLLFSLCRRRQPFRVDVRPIHFQQFLNITDMASLPNLALRPIYDKAFLVGTLR